MADGPVPAELEAKLLVPRDSDLRAIGRLTAVGPYPLRARDAVRLHSLYLDTADLTLARHGVALRVRRQAGRWEATAKWAGRVDAAVHERPELTVPLDRAPQMPFLLPEGPLRMHLRALAAGRPLTPILISDIYRRRFDVLPPAAPDGAQPLAELALDRVRLRAPQTDPDQERETVYLEVEIERLHCERRDITRMARLLQHAFNLTPSIESKFARGLTLIYGAVPAASSERVLAQDTVEAATRKIVGRHLRRLRACDPGTRAGVDPEALHNMRVAVRRLRAAVRALAAGLPPRLAKYCTEELRWLGEITGGVRDLDVQLANLQQYGAGLPPGHRAGLVSFRTYMETERGRQRTQLLAGLDARRYFTALLRMEAFARGRTRVRRSDAASQESIVRVGREGIKRTLRRLLKRGDKVRGAPTPEDLHALRIRAKRLRYLLEFLQDIISKPGRRLVKRLVRLQDLLGAYHDAVVTADFVRRYVEGPGAELDAASLLTLGAVANNALRTAEEKRADFQRTWQRFARKRTRNEFRSVLRSLRTLEGPVPTPTDTKRAAPAVRAVHRSRSTPANRAASRRVS
jgi:triphosphatase